MVHTVVFRVASAESLAFWHERLSAEGLTPGAARPTGSRSPTSRGCGCELEIDTSGDQPLVAEHPEIPPEHAIRGFAGVRAYAADADLGRDFLEQTLGVRAGRRGALADRAASGAAPSTPATRRPPSAG